MPHIYFTVQDDSHNSIFFIFNSPTIPELQNIFNLHDSIIIVYFLTSNVFQQQYYSFRSNLKQIPSQILQNKLRFIYLFNIGKFQRTIQFLDFTSNNSIIYRNLHYFNNLNSLFDNTFLDINLLTKIPQQFQNILGVQLNNLRINSFNQNLSSYPQNIHGIPEILAKLLQKQKSNPKIIGIFRKSPEIDVFNQFYAQLLVGDYDLINQVEDPHLISKSILKFIQSLKNPLIQYDQIKDQISPQITINKNCIKYKVLGCIIGLLQYIQSFQDENQMSYQNLAIIFTPALVRLEGNQLYDVKIIILHIQQLLEQYCQLWKQFEYEQYL